MKTRCTHTAGICDHLVCDKETTMTITDSIDCPTADTTLWCSHQSCGNHQGNAGPCLRATRPTHVSHWVTEAIIDQMRAAGREELVHYAGASYRDAIAWQVCVAWLAQPWQPESVLKSRALAIAAPSWALSPEQIRANNPGMR